MSSQRDLRPDPVTEGRIESWLRDSDLTPWGAERGLDWFLREFPVTPQTRRQFLGRWLDRDEGARRRARDRDHPPVPETRRNRLMFSATGSVAALAVLALGVSVVTDGDPQPPAAGSGTTHVVALDGSGDFSTIGEAVAVAADGDTILVRPGTYTEAIVIGNDITLRGDGDREDIVITAPEDGPTSPMEWYADDPYALLIVDAEATVSGVTFRGKASQVHASGGSPTLTDLLIDGVAEVYQGGSNPRGNSIVVTGGSTATVRGNTITDSGPIGVFEASAPLIEGNTLTGGPHIWGGFGDGTVIRGNTIEGPLVRGIGVFDVASLTIEGNTITGSGQDGLSLAAGSPLVRANVISGSGILAILVETTGEATISGNELTDNNMAISWSSAVGLIDGNTIQGGVAGIVIGRGSPTVSGNAIEGVENRGIAVSAAAAPTLVGNTSCGNGTNLFIADGATPTIDDTNTICEDAPAE